MDEAVTRRQYVIVYMEQILEILSLHYILNTTIGVFSQYIQWNQEFYFDQA